MRGEAGLCCAQDAHEAAQTRWIGAGETELLEKVDLLSCKCPSPTPRRPFSGSSKFKRGVDCI